MTRYDLGVARQDHFQLLGLPRAYALDRAALESAYRDVQARVHPDKHAHLADADRRAAMQWATQVNEAYRTLRDPILRGRYLLHLAGFDAGIETNTAMPVEFLVEQMELRETVAGAREAGDAAQLEELDRQMRRQMAVQHGELAQALDVAHDHSRAGDIVRRLMFHEKLLSEIDAALEAVEA